MRATLHTFFTQLNTNNAREIAYSIHLTLNYTIREANQLVRSELRERALRS